MSTKVNLPFNLPREIARYKLLTSIINLNEYKSVLTLTDEKAFKSLLKAFARAIARAIMHQKTFDEKSKAFDPVIPIINNPVSLEELFVHIGFEKQDAAAAVEKLSGLINSWSTFVPNPIKTGLLQLKKDSFELKRNPTDRATGAVDRIIGERVLTTKLSYIDEDFSISIPLDIYNKLANLFEKHNPTRANMNECIFVAWLRYKSITFSSAEHYHWAIEPKYVTLLREAGVKTELFASPLNCTFDVYYSLFPDIDKYFGSRGTYIDAFEREELSGLVEANPPFIDSVELDLINRVETYIQKNPSTYFVLIVSKRDDYEAYNRMIKSKYLLSTNPNALRDPTFVSHMGLGATITNIPGVDICCFVFGQVAGGKDEDDDSPLLPSVLCNNN